ncbi:MAG: hypothetical protein NWE85_05610 [Candidatus Bathyarchaeota archaeon]|nr:hypothetical protein [Candidatus Bathyarchaeota archaeon]
MVTREMAERGKVCAQLEFDAYKRILGKIRNNLPPHVWVSPERVKVEGRKVVRLWCAYPKIGERAVKRALGVSLESSASTPH